MPKHYARRDFLKQIGLGTAAWSLSSLAFSAAPDRPNIIFVMVDDMGWADLGCYGEKAIETPNLDRMAAEGIRFTDAYAGAPVCAPSRSTLMTGQHLGRTPVRGNTGGIPLPDDAVTLAEVLKSAGYATGGFGKWGLGDLRTSGVPERQGFDLFFGYYDQVHAHFYYPNYLIENGRKIPLPGNKSSRKQQFSHYLIRDRMFNWIRENKDGPFFCYAPWTLPHAPFPVPKNDRAWQEVEDKKWGAACKGRAAYNLMIDRAMGRLFDLLKELGIDDNTIVFFCSDNGASNRCEGSLDSNGPLRGKKRTTYEGGIRVPMIVRWPGKIASGRQTALPTYFPDIMPTLAALAGAEQYMPNDIDGLSILPTLLNHPEQQEKHEFMYWEFPRFDHDKRVWTGDWRMQGVRFGKWKAVREDRRPWELYDLSTDIGEQNDVASEHKEIVGRINAWVARNRTEMPPQVEPLGSGYR